MVTWLGLFIVRCRPAVIESQCLYGSMVDGGYFSRGPPIATANDLAPAPWLGLFVARASAFLYVSGCNNCDREG